MNRRSISVDRNYLRPSHQSSLHYLIGDSGESDTTDYDDVEEAADHQLDNGNITINNNKDEEDDEDDEEEEEVNGKSKGTRRVYKNGGAFALPLQGQGYNRDVSTSASDQVINREVGLYRQPTTIVRSQSMGQPLADTRQATNDSVSNGNNCIGSCVAHHRRGTSSSKSPRSRTRSKSSERRSSSRRMRQRSFGSTYNVRITSHSSSDESSSDEVETQDERLTQNGSNINRNNNNNGNRSFSYPSDNILPANYALNSTNNRPIKAHWNQCSKSMSKVSNSNSDFWPAKSDSRFGGAGTTFVDSTTQLTPSSTVDYHHQPVRRPKTLYILPTSATTSYSTTPSSSSAAALTNRSDFNSTAFYPTPIQRNNSNHQRHHPQPSTSTIDLVNCEKKLLDDVLNTLNCEKESLVFQVNMMNDQIEAQNERIKELESSLAGLNSRLSASQHDSTQHGSDNNNLCSKVILEETRRSLINEIARLKRDCISSNKEKTRLTSLESECANLKATLLEREAETGLLRLALAKIAKNTGYTLSDPELQLIRGSISTELLLKVGHDLVSPLQNDDHLSIRCANKPPLVPRLNQVIVNDEESINTNTNTNGAGNNNNYRGRSVSPNLMTRKSSMNKTQPVTNHNNHMVNHHLTDPQSTYSAQRSYNVYGTMPRAYGSQIYQRLQQQHQQQQQQSSSSSSTSTSSYNNNNHGPSSDHDLAHHHHHQQQQFAQDDHIIRGSGQASNPDIYRSTVNNISNNNFTKDQKSKGIKKFFSIIKKNDSNGSTNGFVRGGVRSTAGPRLVAGERRKIEVNLPFSRLDNILLAQWLSMIGLGMYSEACRRTINNGDQLLNSSDSDLEKDLGIKNKLHRKKLRLALSMVNNTVDPLTRDAHQLDYLWIARWLDDIGLPQYKENFINGRIDGAVLHKLTIQDLVHLNINSKVHYCSLKRGIQLLRFHRFNTDTLKRRATPDESKSTDLKPEKIALWTSHRVMEWLRSIDLSEYTPNLRGSGIHGALIIYEPAFDSDLLASLLSIPSSRTLLRRHIATHFNKLIGLELVQIKRDYRSKSPILTPSSKISIKNVKFSIIKRRLKTDFHLDELVCPMDSDSETKQTSDDNNENNFNATTIDNKMFLQSESQV